MNHEMTRRKLVDTFVHIAIDEVIDGEAEVLRDPPGRRPPMDLVARSEWFVALEADEQSLVIDTMREVAYGALHRVLVALDGATPVGPGRLRLMWETAESVVDLTDASNEVALHDLLAEIVGR